MSCDRYANQSHRSRCYQDPRPTPSLNRVRVRLTTPDRDLDTGPNEYNDCRDTGPDEYNDIRDCHGNSNHPSLVVQARLRTSSVGFESAAESRESLRLAFRFAVRRKLENRRKDASLKNYHHHPSHVMSRRTLPLGTCTVPRDSDRDSASVASVPPDHNPSHEHSR
jgi:hypothetical protein